MLPLAEHGCSHLKSSPNHIIHPPGGKNPPKIGVWRRVRPNPGLCTAGTAARTPHIRARG